MEPAPVSPSPVVRAPADQIQGLSRGLRVLEQVHAAGRPVAVKEIAAAAGLNLSTVYHLVNTLLHEGYLVRTGDRLLVPGRVPGQGGGARAAGVQRALGRAAYAVDEVAVLARLDGVHTRVTATAEVPQAACAGHYRPQAACLSHLVAVGRVLIAYQPAEPAERLIELTARAAAVRGEVFDQGELRDDLQTTVDRGFCTLIGDGDACLAVPVTDGGEHAVAAVAVVIPPRRLRRELDRLVAVSSLAARELAAVLDLACPLTIKERERTK
jgi:DNA-binding IclR family transcriptional regulator